ncbi:hypothetical protein NQ318_006151 [Aromia moschata]|uniref:Uncharacterized protein n=1 Tax=Aromia moschata TaxID=1265417 RepID=A0AAV8XN08_9CUCU|nr:hypothetical protein NQ318_006151 [Aromia moschata]
MNLKRVNILRNEILAGTSFEEIKRKFVTLCVRFEIETELVCSGFFDVYGPKVVPAYKASNLASKEACSLIFGETCGELENELHEWDVDIPDFPTTQLTK